MTTWADGAVDGGTVTVQVFWAGQLVGATCPLKVATIWPLVLRKLDPAIVTLCPAEPLEGLKDVITGGPLGATAAVEEVDVGLEGGVVAGDGFGAEVAVGLPPPVRGLVDGWRVGAAVVWTECVAEGGEDAGLAINETSRAIAAATTRAPAAATERISQRLGSAGGGLPAGAEGGFPAGAPGWVTGTDTTGSAGPVEACPGDGGGGEGGATPADSRARRTALSIAPRAR
jgi:hypothetical protein